MDTILPMLKRSLCCTLGLVRALLLILPLSTALAGQPKDEVVAGLSIPIPSQMSPSTDQGMELMVPGFKGGQTVYQGSVNPREVIRFYQTNMPLKGWQPYASLVTGGGLLVFTQANKSILIMVSESKGETTLAILVGVLPPGP